MGWIPGCPQDPATPKGSLAPRAVVLHRTYGQWAGDYAVIRREGTCQLLIGKEPGQWVQFMSTDSVAYHCNGANFMAFGVELTGVNEEPLTDWQADRLGEVLHYAEATHGIPLAYVSPDAVPPASIWVNGGGFNGIISHVSVMTDNGSPQHTDAIAGSDVLRALGRTSPDTGVDDDMPRQFISKQSDPSVGVWEQAGNTRRHVYPDEWKFLNDIAALFGGPPPTVLTVSQQWWDSLPDVVSMVEPASGGGGVAGITEAQVATIVRAELNKTKLAG